MTPAQPATETRIEKHCGYCRKWREASTFSTVKRKRGKSYFDVPICAICKANRQKPATVEQRDAFGARVTAEAAEEQRRKTAILNEKKNKPTEEP